MAETRARPVDRVVGGYLVVSSLALAAPHRPTAWPVLFLVHLIVAWGLLSGTVAFLRSIVGRDTATARGRAGRVWRLLADWYPLLFLPLLYWELPVLGSAIWGGHYFDVLVQGWETAVFGGQPAITLAERWPSLLVSEPLHFFYLSYYPILYVFPVLVYLRRGREAFYDTLFAMMLGFAVHYLVFTAFPVKGPYFVFPAPGEPQSAGPMYQTVQWALATGASAGTAFPSSHVALSVVQTMNAIRHYRPAAPVLAVCTVGIMAGAVYAGIHYAIDVVVGLVTGLAVALVEPRLRRRLKS
ncbi:MAG: phosphatase PAP2 family protein [Longimicrobiales bacterium]|nr:phosphatase PAP2 family protein [Longimicrobiales bacterium]